MVRANSGKPRDKPPPARAGNWAPWAPAAAWAYLLCARGRYWSTTDRAAPWPTGPGAAPSPWPPVAVVVPARDEAPLLPLTLPALLNQQYPGHAWVVLVDDQSTDGTASVARELAVAGGGRGLGLTIVAGGPTPPGWAGKPWAMAQGARVALGAPAPPGYLLFTDADIHHPPGSLRALVGAAQAGQLAAVSLMARLPTEPGWWSRLLLPAFVYFFAQIYPFSWVNDPHRGTAAAAGGCLLVAADALEEAGGIDAIAASTIDDVALAGALKRAGFDIWLGLAGVGDAPLVESRRRYPRLQDVWEMVARSAYTQLRHNPALLAATMAGLASIYLAPPVLAVGGLVARRPALAVAGLSAWTAMAASYVPTARYYRVPLASATALPFTALVYMAMTLGSARRHRSGQLSWKGRPTR